MSPTMWDHSNDKSGWLFIEFPGFTRCRDVYFPTDEAFADAQSKLVDNPSAGNAMPGCGGVRKLRHPDPRRSKGTRGGLRLIYLQVPEVRVIALLDVYDKNEKDDLSAKERKSVAELAAAIKAELMARFGKGK